MALTKATAASQTGSLGSNSYVSVDDGTGKFVWLKAAQSNTVLLDAWLDSSNASHSLSGQVSFAQIKKSILEEYKFFKTGTWDANDAYKSLNQFVAGSSGVETSNMPTGIAKPQSFISEYYGDSTNGFQRVQIFGSPASSRGIWSRILSGSAWTNWQREASNNWQYTATPATAGDIRTLTEGDNVVVNDGDIIKVDVANSVMGCMLCPATDWSKVPAIGLTADATTKGWTIVGTQPSSGTEVIHLVPGIFDKTINIKKVSASASITLQTEIRDSATAVDSDPPSELAVRKLFDTINLTGEMVTPFSNTFATLEAVPDDASSTVRYSTILTQSDTGTGTAEAPQYPAGIYISGAAQADGWALGYKFSEATNTLNDAMFQGRTDVTLGVVSGKLAYDRDQAVKGLVANFTSTDTDHDIAKPWTAKDLIEGLGSRTELNALLGVSLSDKDLGAFTGATIPDDATVKSALQALEGKLEDLKITGRFIGSSATFATLPTTSTETGAAINKDWAYKSAAEVGTGTAEAPQYPKGVYLYNGSAYSFAFDFSIDLINLTQTQVEDKASTVFGEVSGQRLNQAIVKNTFTGADGTTAGAAGSVPAPTATDNVKYLRGDSTWADLSIPWVFADKVDVTVAAGSTRPTNAEILTWANSKTPKIRNSFIYYTASSVDSDPEQYTWFIDSKGKVAIMRGREIAAPRWVSGDVVTPGTFRYNPYIIGDDVNVLLLMPNGTAQRTTAASFTVAEAAAWVAVSQDFVAAFPPNTVVPRGYMIRESGTLYQCTVAHLTPAEFDANEIGKWTHLSAIAWNFLPNTDFTMALSGRPTVAEFKTRLLQKIATISTRNRFFYYTGTDTESDEAVYIWLVDILGDIKTIKSPLPNKVVSLHDLGAPTIRSLRSVNHQTEAHFEGGLGYSINASESVDGDYYYLLNTSGSEQKDKLTFSNFAGAYLRNGADEKTITSPFTIAKGIKYLASVTDNGGNKYLNIVPLAPTLTWAVQNISATGNITAWGSTVVIGGAPLTANITLTLPTASGNIGKVIRLIRADNTAFTVTLASQAGETLSTLNNANELSSQHGSITVEAITATSMRQVSQVVGAAARSITGTGIAVGTLGRDRNVVSVRITGLTAGSEIIQGNISANGGATVDVVDTGRNGTATVNIIVNGNDTVVTYTQTIWRRTVTAIRNTDSTAVNVDGVASKNIDATMSQANALAVPDGFFLSAVTITGGTVTGFTDSGLVSYLPSNAANVVITATFSGKTKLPPQLSQANAGIAVAYGTIAVQIAGSGGRALQVRSNTGASITLRIQNLWSDGGAGSGLVNMTATTTMAYINSSWNFGNAGQHQTALINDITNNRFYYVVAEIGASYNNCGYSLIEL
jgi:hypothetical protein